MVVNCFQDRGKSHVQSGHILKSEGVPEDLNFLALGVGDDLPSDVDRIGEVEDVESQIVGQVGIVDLLKRGEPELHDVLDFLPTDLRLSKKLLPALFS